MGGFARVSRCFAQFDAPHVQLQRAAHLKFEWFQEPLLGSNWLSELSAPTFSPKVALDPTDEAGIKNKLAKADARH